MAACRSLRVGEGFISILRSQLRLLSLANPPRSSLHTSTNLSLPATFSVSRAIWGKTQAELEEEKGIPEPEKQKIHHCRRSIRSGPRKVNLVARQIRGLSISEAVKQMEFSPKRAATTVKEVLEEAQNMAVKQHGVEDRDNLWIAESYVGKGTYYKKLRYHARGRFGIERRKFCHYFLVLKEGPLLGKNKRRRLKNMSELEEIRRHPRHIRNSLSWW